MILYCTPQIVSDAEKKYTEKTITRQAILILSETDLAGLTDFQGIKYNKTLIHKILLIIPTSPRLLLKIRTL